ncbi:MAG: hypothetical protein R3B67_09860 [Phycisphaerales bacterium]
MLNMEPLRLALVGDGTSTLHIALGMSIYLVGLCCWPASGACRPCRRPCSRATRSASRWARSPPLLGFGGRIAGGLRGGLQDRPPRVEHEIANKPKAPQLRNALLRASTVSAADRDAGAYLAQLALRAHQPAARLVGRALGVLLFGTLMGMFRGRSRPS